MINNNEKRVKTQTMENKMDTVFIKDIHVGMKNLTLTCIVLEVGPPVALKENREVRTVKVADPTACINLAVWDDAGHYINASDILRLTKVYATLWRNSLTLYTSKAGTVEKIGEFCMLFNDQLNMSEIVQQPPPSSQPPNNPPNGGNSAAVANPGYARNAALTANSHAAGPQPPLLHGTGGGSSGRYEPPRNSSRNNGQPGGDDPSAANPRNRAERR